MTVRNREHTAMARTTLATTASAPGFPSLEQVIKSREVEDPVNLWVHRPLAYAFCRLIYRTPITPNQVTVLAIGLGLAAALCWVDGSRSAMVWGGALLWASAIMDGADGILARAKHAQSSLGRALDGSADMLVGLSTVAACLYHLNATGTPAWLMLLGGFALVITVLQLNLYDFYKELHLRMTRLDRGGEGDSVAEAERLRQSVRRAHAPWYTRLAMGIYSDYLRFQERLIGATNPQALRLMSGVVHTRTSAAIYRQRNQPSMRLWMAVSLAPHSYLFAIFGMLDRLELYVLLRVSVMFLLSMVGLVLQRRATQATMAEFRARGFA
jgi:phosphatidylglycerophosphate synthase